ncbi:hypothetical protein PbB2_01300 [Candidatus Phycosocius bacilliformis]|uniref:Uncharacterized protein n=2 Tax=Candidatus Phycosocius bacilliformis TaxID=1445552 RepID=A0A2P2E990_9PROT|nr:hypothetical protein PbB2_01300 [Candidatus Phycosocius bacilliformis]
MRRVSLTVLTGLMAAGLMVAPVEAATPGRTEFEILMNGKPVGRHIVTVSKNADTTLVRVAIDMAGRVGPISFTYRHRCEEAWMGDQLASLNCTDQENRSVKTVTANRKGNALEVNGTGFKGNLPASLLPSSWWRASTINQTNLIDSRDGKLSKVRVSRVGDDVINVAGTNVRAGHYRMRGAVNTDLWYDASGRWVRTAFKIAGQSFDYRKLTPVAGSPRE